MSTPDIAPEAPAVKSEETAALALCLALHQINLGIERLDKDYVSTVSAPLGANADFMIQAWKEGRLHADPHSTMPSFYEAAADMRENLAAARAYLSLLLAVYQKAESMLAELPADLPSWNKTSDQFLKMGEK